VSAGPRPAAEVDVTEDLVRRLLAAQHPDLAGLPLTLADSGWDNVIFRLGDQRAVRLPRRAAAVPLVAHEQRWLPELAPRLPLPIPAPERVGLPGAGYPWPWSVLPWFPGATALATPPTDLGATADALGRFLAALHRPAPPEAPVNPFRGRPVASCTDRVHDRLDQLGPLVDRGALLAVLADAVAAPVFAGPPVWLHGDVHPGNLVVADGALAAVIDFGDLTAGDPASDLAVAWMLFPPALRPRFVAATGHDDPALWRRARGWAVNLGLAILAHSAEHPGFATLGHTTLAAAVEG
jgi:aminoglycoside phosphotransferase (APT) family kinase protein